MVQVVKNWRNGKNQESIKEALADLRRKANLSLSKSDNIKKTLGAMKKK